MLEYAMRMEIGIPGCPVVKLQKSIDFFKTLEEKAKKKKFPKWVGELYLEYHRGTYTSMARNKKFNRKAEFMLNDIELFSIISCSLDDKKTYPQQEINRAWEVILLNQFHDILPGSSIKEVYDESKMQYENLFARGKTFLNNAFESICKKINIESTSIVVFNQLGFLRDDIAEFELPKGFNNIEITDESGNIMNSQISLDGKAIFFAENVPPKGYKVFKVKNIKTEEIVHEISASAQKLCNKYFDIKFDSSLNIVSIYDKVNCREIIKPGNRANVLLAFEDKPYNFDAWDINVYYQEKMWEINNAESAKVIEDGPVRAGIRIKRKFLDSTIIQNIYIYSSIPRIDFVNKIDWKEKHILLKAFFPVDIHAEKASYDIQFGNVERPAHYNTSWDFAKFEVCAHKWADISEDGYGVSLLNDCKYGYDINDSVMRITLLKSAAEPNVDADREVHEFTYSLYPHSQDFKRGGTVNEAYKLNCPMYVQFEDKHFGTLPCEFSYVKCSSENVIVETLKKAEDSGSFIIRVYECFNRRTKVTLNFFKELSGVWECSLMEDIIKEIIFYKNSFEFEINPYEIKTFMFRLNKN